jgi:hypothetical protein
MHHRTAERLSQRLLLVPAVLLAIGPSALAGALMGSGDYHVRGTGSDTTGDGSAANPWRTITHAVDQAGGGQPTIHVGPGTYDAAAGEVVPIRPDEHDDLGAIFLGTGDFGADASLIENSIDGSPIFDTDDMVEGTIVISGFLVHGNASTKELLDIDAGAELVVVANNEISDIGILEVHADRPGEYVIVQNKVVSCYQGVDFNPAATTGTTAGVDLLVYGNQFIDADNGVDIDARASTTSENLRFHLDVSENVFLSCEDAVQLSAELYSSASLFLNGGIKGNEFEDCGVGLSADLWMSSDVNCQRLLQVKNNDLACSETAILLDTGVSSSAALLQMLVVEGNRLSAQDRAGVHQSLTLHGSAASVDQEVYIAANIIEECGTAGVNLECLASYSGNAVANDVAIIGNTIRDCWSEGIHILTSCSGSVEVEASHSIRYNSLLGNRVGVRLAYVQDGPGAGAATHDVRANCLENDWDNFIVIYDVDGAASDVTADLEAGTWPLMGYNTIVRPNGRSGQADSTVNILCQEVSGAGVPTADLIGNWWGTQDSAEIQERIYDGNDQPVYIVADASNPLADDLDFTVSKVGTDLRLDAGPDAGFVPYVGRLLPGGPGASEVPVGYNKIKVFVDGVQQDPDLVDVADDYRSLAFPIPPGMTGSGSICVMNPCGQMGCTDFDFCVNNVIPTAQFDGVETEMETPVLIDVLANDFDPEGGLNPRSMVITHMPEHGTLVVNPDGESPGTVLYTPDPGWTSCDTFNYTVADWCGEVSNVATVQVCIVNAPPPNHAPKANYDAAATDPMMAVTVDVLANDADVDGDPLDPGSVVIEWAGNKGHAAANPDGTVTYTPHPGTRSTTDTFNYSMADIHGERSNIATVEITISGGSGKAGG